MRVVDLKKDMDRQFGELKADMDARFTQVDARFTRVDARFDNLEARIEQKIAAEHETTRRHMEILVEQVKAEYRLGLDRMMTTDQHLAYLTASNAGEHTTFVTVLQDHEVRIKALEPGGESPETSTSST